MKERDIKLEINNVNNFLIVCEQLESKSFIGINKANNLRLTKLSLAIEESEAEQMLKKDSTIKFILS